jgi:acyl-CoA synthetase (AMP-forming)/AMP-acid ligase II
VTEGIDAAAVVAALIALDVRPAERVLVMLPDGPGFAETLVAVTQRGALPLPANPLLTAHDVAAAAVESGAKLVFTVVERIHALANLDAEPPVLVPGPHGPWAAAVRLR